MPVNGAFSCHLKLSMPDNLWKFERSPQHGAFSMSSKTIHARFAVKISVYFQKFILQKKISEYCSSYIPVYNIYI